MLRVVALLVHADGAVHAVVQEHDDGFGTVLRGSGQLLPVHQKVAVTGHGQHHAAGGDGRCNAGRYAITHRAIGGCQLRFVPLGQAVVLVKAVHPAGKVARAVGVDSIIGQVFLQGGHNGRHIDIAWQLLRHQVERVIGVAGGGPATLVISPRQADGGCQNFQGACRRVHGGLYRQISLVNTVKLFCAGVNVHQLLQWFGRLQPAVAAGGHLTQTRSNGDDQIGLFEFALQLGVDANADVARVLRVEVVKGVLKTKGVAYRQLPVFGKTLQRLGRLRGPTAAAGDHKRPLRRQQHFTQGAQAARVAPGLYRSHFGHGGRRNTCRIGGHYSGQHVLGQDQHHRARPTVHGGGKGPRHVFRDAPHVVNALHPLGHAAGAGAKKA